MLAALSSMRLAARSASIDISSLFSNDRSRPMGTGGPCSVLGGPPFRRPTLAVDLCMRRATVVAEGAIARAGGRPAGASRGVSCFIRSFGAQGNSDLLYLRVFHK